MNDLDPEVRELLALWASRPSLPVSQLTAAAVRKDDLRVLELQREPGALASVEDLEIPAPGGNLSTRVYRPGPGLLHPVLFLHGGGFMVDRRGYDAPLREVALSSGCLIVAPECRRAPEQPYPAALEDALAAGRWLTANAVTLGASTATPAVAGDSSGGTLAALVTSTLSREGAGPSFQVLIYPLLDATTSSASYEEFSNGYGYTSEKSRWYLDQYLPAGTDRRAPTVSPLFDRDVRDQPHTLIVTAEYDPLRDDGESYARVLGAADVNVELRRYRGMVHGFFQMTGSLEGSRRMHRELGTWMRAQARLHAEARLREYLESTLMEM